MNHETTETMSKRKKPFTVDYTGFGWVMIKNGVFENLEYPWFAPKMQVFESGNVQDMCGEDVSFCLDAKEAGFDIWCDPRIRVGHEKTAYHLIYSTRERGFTQTSPLRSVQIFYRNTLKTIMKVLQRAKNLMLI